MEIKKQKRNILIIIIILLISNLLMSGCITSYDRSWVEVVLLSPDGTQLLTRDTELTIQVWNISSGSEIYRFEPVNAGRMAWLPDGKRFAVNTQIATDTWRLIVYNSSHFEELWRASNTPTIFSSHDIGMILINSIGNNKYNISIWNLTNYTFQKKLNISLMSDEIVLSPTGTKIAYFPYGGDALKIIDVTNESDNQTLEKMYRSISEITYQDFYCFQWSNDNNKIALLTSFTSDSHLHYYLWNASNYSLICNTTFSLSKGYADLSPDCSKFIYGNLRERNVTIFKATTGEILYTLEISESNGIKSVDWSSDERTLAAGTPEGIIKIWNATTGEHIQTLLTPKDYQIPT